MTECKSGVGRIVWGHPLEPRQKRDQQTKQIILKEGQPVIQYAFGVAFPKAEFQAMIWPAMEAEARSGYPPGVPNKFAWKYDDGDGIDSNGQPFNLREGYAGCYVLSITSNLPVPPSVYKWNPARNNYDQVSLKEIKCGDYVVCALNFKVNVPTDRTHSPSLYVNPSAIELVGYGSQIVSASTVDPMTAFGGQQYQLPPGASTVPMAPSGGVNMPGTMQPAPMQQPQQYQQPAPMQQPQQYQQPAPMQQPGQMPYQPQQPPMQPQQYQQPAPMQQPQQQLPPPAPNFIPNAGMPQQYQQPAPMQQYQPAPPMQQPGQMPMPGQMPPR